MKKLLRLIAIALAAFVFLTAIGHVVADQEKKKEGAKDALRLPPQEKKQPEEQLLDRTKKVIQNLQKTLKKLDDLEAKFEFNEPKVRIMQTLLKAMEFPRDRDLFENDDLRPKIMKLFYAIHQYDDEFARAEKRNDLPAAQKAAAHAERIFRQLSEELIAAQKQLKRK